MLRPKSYRFLDNAFVCALTWSHPASNMSLVHTKVIGLYGHVVLDTQG